MNEHCNLYMRIGADTFASCASSAFSSALSDAGIKAVLVTGLDASLPDKLLVNAVQSLKNRDIAILFEEEFERALAVDADGVHLAASTQRLNEARKALGPDRMIGISCALSRHDAMEMAEAGADYVAFGQTGEVTLEQLQEMVAWWSKLFEVPSVAWLEDEAVETGVPLLVEAGADFISLPGGSTEAEFNRIAELAARLRNGN